MDQSISAVIGAIIFTAFVAGLAESIGATPFIIIVLIVVVAMGFCVVQVIKETWKSEKSNRTT